MRTSYFIGCVMLLAGGWMFLDSVWIRAGHGGMFSRYYGGSMLITMAPLMLGIFLLFFIRQKAIGWTVAILGLALVVLDVISSLHFRMHLKLWQWIVVLVFGVGGLGLILRGITGGKTALDQE